MYIFKLFLLYNDIDFLKSSTMSEMHFIRYCLSIPCFFSRPFVRFFEASNWVCHCLLKPKKTVAKPCVWNLTVEKQSCDLDLTQPRFLGPSHGHPTKTNESIPKMPYLRLENQWKIVPRQKMGCFEPNLKGPAFEICIIDSSVFFQLFPKKARTPYFYRIVQ